jgi:hypothetical protein
VSFRRACLDREVSGEPKALGLRKLPEMTRHFFSSEAKRRTAAWNSPQPLTDFFEILWNFRMTAIVFR